MKRFLIVLFASSSVTNFANAETVWLVYGAQHSSVYRGSVLDKIPMKNEKQCLEQGPRLEFLVKPSNISNDKNNFRRKPFDDVAWGCIKGR